jgi:hypothetical protein
VTAGLAVTAGLLATGLSMTPANAAVRPATLSACEPGTSNSYEFYGWCSGSGTTSYRAIAMCANGNAVYGVELYDGDPLGSFASCEVDGQDSTLSTTEPDWGYLECSNNNGSGTYSGYKDISGDISWMLLNWGNGNIATGGNTLCDYDTSGEAPFNPNTAP